MMETVLILPWFLLVLFGVVQFSFLWVGKLMTEYAAFCAARAALVYPNADIFTDEAVIAEAAEGGDCFGVSGPGKAPYQAARQILAWVSFSSNRPQTDPVEVPGWGRVKASGAVDRQLRVRVERLEARPDAPGSVTAAVTFYFPLFVPVVSTLVPAMISQEPDAPKRSVAVRARCTLPQPWSTVLWPARPLPPESETP